MKVTRKPFHDVSERDRWRSRNYGTEACRRSDTDRIAQLLMQGVPLDVACVSVGIDREAAFEWLKNGESFVRASSEMYEDISDQHKEIGERYAYFYRRVNKAIADFKIDVVIQDIRGPAWARGITISERRDPANWGRLTPRGEDSPSKLEVFDPDPTFL